MPEVWCWHKNVYGRNCSSWSAVRVDAGKHVDFCRGFVLSTAERSRVTYFKSDKAYGVLLFHRAMSVRDGKARSRAKLVFFGLDPAPPSFRHARPRVRRPWRLDFSVLGTVSKSVVPDLFRKSARQEKEGTSPLAVCGGRRAEIGGVLVGEGEHILSGSTSTTTR